MQAEIKEIVEQSLKKAREHFSRQNAGQAYAYYIAVVELSLENRPKVEKEITDVLCEFGMQLEENNRIRDVIKCYEHCLEHYPRNSRMLNNFAAHLLRNGEPIKAMQYLKRALEVDPNFLPAERNFQNACSMAVDRWHFPMLNDRRRNHAYDKAIRKKIALGYNSVLDIGTGTGLLSLYARDAGAYEIYACESSPIMSEIAGKIFAKNNSGKIKLLPKVSMDLKIPEDIPQRVQLIITEIFDAGLFGELVVPSLIDAHKRLLSESGVVIPSNATLYVSAVECEYIRFRSSVKFHKSNHFEPLKFENISVLSDEPYYDTENLQYVKICHITEPQGILDVNFNDLTELLSLSIDGLKNRITTECRYEGTVDGIVAWFKLNLDEEISIDTSQGKSCWQLAVFPSIPINFKKGDKISVSAEISAGKLKCSYTSNKLSNKEEKHVFHLPKEVITFFNDRDYISSLTQAVLLEKEKVESVLDTSPFPIFGMSLMKSNPNCKVLYYQSEDLMLCSFIKKVFEDNKIKGEIRFLTDFSEIDSPIDRIFIHNFDINGELKDWGQESYHDIFGSLLSSRGTLFPIKINLLGQLVFSEDLSKMVSVKNYNVQSFCSCAPTSNSEKTLVEENSCKSNSSFSDQNPNYEIAEFINEYKINQVIDLNSSLYQHEAITEVKTLMEMDETEVKEHLINFGKLDPSKKVPNALIVWYKIKFSGTNECETRRNNSFMNHIAVVLEDEIKESIQRDGEVKIKILQMRHLIKFSVTGI